MVSIDHVRIAQSVSESTVIELYDDTALVVDAAIANLAGGKIQFEYGYVNGMMSDKYEATITKYSTRMIGFSALCTIEAISTGIVTANVDTATKNKKYSGTISDIVYQVASEEGWDIGIVEATKVDKTYDITRNGEAGNEFVKNKLVKKALSAENGKGDYKFELKTVGSKSVVYFTRGDIPASIDNNEGDSNKNNAIDPYDYQYVMGMPNDNIISFEPQYNEVLSALIGAASVQGSAMDPETNEEVIAEVNDEEAIVQLEQSMGSSVKNIVRHVAGNSYSYSDLKTIAKSLHDAAASLSYNATLVIKGKPRISPNTKIKILVLTREGMKHHSSGEYLITSVDDLVENAVYTTTLELLKNSDSVTVTTGSGTSSTSTGPSSNMPTGSAGPGVPADLAEKVKKYLGTPYVWGGDCWEEGGFDCSGFVWYFLKNECGANIGGRDTAAGLSTKGTAVQYDSSLSNLQPGDLLFKGNPATHVVMYMGGNQVVHSPQTGDVIKYSNLWFTPSAVRRFL